MTRFIDFLMREDERMRGQGSPRGDCPLVAIDSIVSDGPVSSDEIDRAVYGLCESLSVNGEIAG